MWWLVSLQETEHEKRYRGEGHVTMGTEIGKMHLRANECQRLAIAGNQERGGAGSLSASMRTSPADTLMSDMWPPAL